MNEFCSYSGKKEMFPMAASLVKNRYLFFVTYYNNVLFKFDLETEHYEEILLPVINKEKWAFRELISYRNKIIFTAMNEHFFLVYDIESGELRTFGKEIFGERKRQFRCSVVIEKTLYLLDSLNNQIIVVDMDDEVCVEIMDLPQYGKEKQIYVYLQVYGDAILIFGKNEKYIVKFTPNNNMSERLVTQHVICFAAISDEWAYYFSSIEDLNGIYRYSLVSGKTELVEKVNYSIEHKIENYRFWNTQKIESKIFFLPCEASEIISYDLLNGKIQKLIPYEEGYVKEFHLNDASVMEMIPYGEKWIVVPHVINYFTVLEADGSINKTYSFYIDDVKERVLENLRRSNNVIDEGIVDLETFITNI